MRAAGTAGAQARGGRGVAGSSGALDEDELHPSDSDDAVSIAPSDGSSAEGPTGGWGAGGGSAAAQQGAERVAHKAGTPHGSSHARLKTININLAACKYSVLRIVARKLGWVEVDDDADWHIAWTDTSAGCERLMRMRRPQKLNHFPGMLEIARKKSLARNLGRMRDAFPAHYDFLPRTFLLPEQGEAFMVELASKRPRPSKTFIMKLDNGSQGRGIKIVQSVASATAAIPTFEHPNIVASQYVANPFLINGYKFDLRIYVLVRCCDPLRVFIHKEGLVRFCTEPYQPPKTDNLGNIYAHLTNYAVNKHNPKFVFNKDAERLGDGSKWSITALAEWMAAAGHDWGRVWGSIKHMIAKSLVAIQPILQYHYRASTKQDDDNFTCFEVLGYDVLLDAELRPWLLEVNHSPSFTVDTPLDLFIKERLITETMSMVGITVQAFREELAAREAAKLHRLYSSHPVYGSPLAAGAAAGGSRNPSHLAQQQQQQPAPQPQPLEPGSAGVQLRQQEQQASQQQQAEQPASPSGDSRQNLAAAAAAGSEAADGGCPGAPAGVSAEWEAAQRRHEEANMGHFERIIPSDDPELQAVYEELQAGARQVFYKQTMQGRLQHALEQIKEKRQHEEAEAAAKAEAHQRRVESLKAWMATVYVKAREHRERGGSQKQEQRLPKLRQQGPEGAGWQGEPALLAAPRSSAAAKRYSAQQRSAALLRSDTACTRSSPADEEGSGGSGGSGSSGEESQGGLGLLEVQGVASPRNTRGPGSCPSSPTGAAAEAADAKPSLPHYTWANKPQQGSVGSALKQAGASPGAGSGRFVWRLSAMQGGRARSCTPHRDLLDGSDNDSTSELPEWYHAEDGRGSKLGSAGNCTLILDGRRCGPGGTHSYIPPAILSSLHDANLGAVAGAGAGEGGGGGAGRLTGALRSQSPAPGASPAAGGHSKSDAASAAQSPLQSRSSSRCRGPTPVGGWQEVRMALCGPKPALPARQGSAGSARSGGGLASSTAALQAEYMRQIERQAVKSIADMIASVLGK